MPMRIAVLASGRGSNLRALHAYLTDEAMGPRGAEIVLVASGARECGALTFAREQAIAAAVIDPGPAGAAMLSAVLATHGVDLVVLAGYVRLVAASVVREHRGRMINVHPALLPAFGGAGMYGARVHQAVLDSGARVTGATVHFVDEVYDRGPIIAQWPVPVFDDDTPATLAARVLRVEHLLLPRTVGALARGRIRLDHAGRVTGVLRRTFPDAAFTLRVEEEELLAHDISAAMAD